MTNDLFTVLSVTAPLALMISLWVMAQISRRFGEVTHRPPLYRGFYVALALLAGPVAVRLLLIGVDSDTGTLDLVYDVTLAISISVAVIVAWRYWGWLIYTRADQALPVTTERRETRP